LVQLLQLLMQAHKPPLLLLGSCVGTCLRLVCCQQLRCKL
jgi:hypothetical protein